MIAVFYLMLSMLIHLMADNKLWLLLKIGQPSLMSLQLWDPVLLVQVFVRNSSLHQTNLINGRTLSCLGASEKMMPKKAKLSCKFWHKQILNYTRVLSTTQIHGNIIILWGKSTFCRGNISAYLTLLLLRQGKCDITLQENNK